MRFDETRLDLADIKSDVRQRGSDAAAQSKAPTQRTVTTATQRPLRRRQMPPSPLRRRRPCPPAAAHEGNAIPTKAPADKPMKPGVCAMKTSVIDVRAMPGPIEKVTAFGARRVDR